MRTKFIILALVFVSSMSFAESLKADCASVNQNNEKSRSVATIAKSVKSQSSAKTSKR